MGEAHLQPTNVNGVAGEVLGLAHSELVTHQVAGSYQPTPGPDAGAAAYLCNPLNDEALIAAIKGAMAAAA